MGFFDDLAPDPDLFPHRVNVFRNPQGAGDAGETTLGTTAPNPTPVRVYGGVTALVEEHPSEESVESDRIVQRTPFTVYLPYTYAVQTLDLLVWVQKGFPDRTIVVRNVVNHLGQNAVWDLAGYELT